MHLSSLFLLPGWPGLTRDTKSLYTRIYNLACTRFHLVTFSPFSPFTLFTVFTVFIFSPFHLFTPVTFHPFFIFPFSQAHSFHLLLFHLFTCHPFYSCRAIPGSRMKLPAIRDEEELYSQTGVFPEITEHFGFSRPHGSGSPLIWLLLSFHSFFTWPGSHFHESFSPFTLFTVFTIFIFHRFHLFTLFTFQLSLFIFPGWPGLTRQYESLYTKIYNLARFRLVAFSLFSPFTLFTVFTFHRFHRFHPFTFSFSRAGPG